jgi:hypothetical protein
MLRICSILKKLVDFFYFAARSTKIYTHVAVRTLYEMKNSKKGMWKMEERYLTPMCSGFSQ